MNHGGLIMKSIQIASTTDSINDFNINDLKNYPGIVEVRAKIISNSDF